MKCLYYLAPSLDSTQRISDHLQEVGVSQWLVHVVSRDEAGLKREKVMSSNYLETLDLLRGGLIGANVGFIVGVIGAGALMFFKPFGPGMPGYVYAIVIAVATLFGSWEGGLWGVARENQKLKRFHDDIDAGKYLILIYAPTEKEETIKNMMRDMHPRTRHVATDRHFINPFSVVRRKRRLAS